MNSIELSKKQQTSKQRIKNFLNKHQTSLVIRTLIINYCMLKKLISLPAKNFPFKKVPINQLGNANALENQIKFSTTDRLSPQQEEEFDEEFYTTIYPDIKSSKIDPYYHYINYGKLEGRLPRAAELNIWESGTFSHLKPTVLVVSHEASRTGAPILTWNICKELQGSYNVVTVFLKGGELAEKFKQVSEAIFVPTADQIKFHQQIYLWIITKQLCKKYTFKFSIVNTVVSAPILKNLAEFNIPSVLLIHEFLAYSRPRQNYIEALAWADQIVFPAKIVQSNANLPQTETRIKATHILPQGKSEIPNLNSETKKNTNFKLFKEAIFENRSKKPFIILGAGTVQYRKGVDFFVAAAAELQNKIPDEDILMVWIGHGFDPENDTHYSVYLEDQIKTFSKVNFKMFSEIDNFEDVYQFIDLFFLSSRLDPLPNVAIDAMTHGIPLLCFQKTTGISEILEANPTTASLVLPFGNISAVVDKITGLYQSPDDYFKLAQDLREIATQHFNMENYVAQLIRIAEKEIPSVETQKNHVEFILNTTTNFIEDYYVPPFCHVVSKKQAVLEYLKLWAAGMPIRKPLPGFNPHAYADYFKLNNESTDPLGHYLLSNKPNGKWCESLIVPNQSSNIATKLKCAIHFHVFYADIFNVFIQALKLNKSQFDLFISVPSLEIKNAILHLLNSYNILNCHIEIVENIGRDIAPLLTTFNYQLQKYDVIGHFHTKKSLAVNNVRLIDAWITFLSENLLGGKFPMADCILQYFAKDKKLGIVYPDDPHNMDWGLNRPFAKELADKMNLDIFPEGCFSFPVGTMFWARPAALKPLFNLQLTLEDYPKEPLPIDGSMLHAIERLLPYVTEKSGFKRKLTYVPTISR